MFALTTDDVLLRVRERIHDRNSRTFDDAEVLRAADDSLRRIFDSLRIHSEDHGLDMLEETVSSGLTLLENGVYQYQLPEWVADIQLLEAIGSGGLPVQIPRASLEEKDLSRGTFRSAGVLWNWGPPGTIQIRGDMQSFIKLRVWFIRAIPPMCYMQGSGAASTTTLTTTSASTGILKRDRAYESQQFQVMAGATGDLNKVVRCSTFTMAAGVATITFSPALSTATGTTTRLSMLVPLDPQHSEYLCDLTAMTLMRRQGSEEEVKMLAGALSESMATFEAAISRRSSGEPPRFGSSRRVR